MAALISDLHAIHRFKTNEAREDQVQVLSEQLTTIFTRAHLDGIKAVLQAMASPLSENLRGFIERIEASLQVKLNGAEQLIVESYVHEHLISLVRRSN